ncbi:MAG: hypothetical protein KatS3mg124_0553 [Porticoccaceae bacterium]|nr:MAG: hypothetical protein KatS3mg124_0553 [Porticoccaceae bacterium]
MAYRILFRGDLATGVRLGEARERLRALFHLDDAGLARLFSGRAVVLKRGLDAAQAERWRTLLERAGLRVEVVAEEGDSAPPRARDYGWEVLPPGADVLRPEERAPPPPPAPPPRLDLAPAGGELLAPEERRTVEPLRLDLDHLRLAEEGNHGSG